MEAYLIQLKEVYQVLKYLVYLAGYTSSIACYQIICDKQCLFFFFFNVMSQNTARTAGCNLIGYLVNDKGR